MAIPIKDLEPFNNKELNTIWELARMISDQNTLYNNASTGDERKDIAEIGIPYLARWLFFKGVPLGIDWTMPEWKSFVTIFITKFLNRETTFIEPNIFRMKCSEMVLEYQEFIENTASSIYEKMLTADSKLKVNSKTNNTGTETGNNKSDSSLDITDNTNRDITGTNNTENTINNTLSNTNTGSVTTTNLGDTTVSGKTTNNLDTMVTNNLNSHTTAENSGTNSSTATSNARNLQSDTPQSIVNANTIGNPALTEWKYASGLVDSNSKTENSGTNSGEETTTTENTGTVNTANTGTVDNNTVTTLNTKTLQEQDNVNTTTGNTTGNTNNTIVSKDTANRTGKNTTATTSTHDIDRNSNTTYEETRDVETPFRTEKDRFDFFMREMRKPMYKVLEKMEDLFISEYVPEYRYGYLDGNEIANITSVIMEE